MYLYIGSKDDVLRLIFDFSLSRAKKFIAVCCDLIVVSEDAKFSERAVRWGATAREYPAYILDMGSRKAKEHLWTGDYIDGRKAYHQGWVNRVVPREKLEEETMAPANGSPLTAWVH